MFPTGNKKGESHPVGQPPPSNIVTVRNENDVLLGRGAPIIHNTGNVRFRELVRRRKDEYTRAERHHTKNEIAREIVEAVHRRNGRFLRKVEDPQETSALGVPEGVTAWRIVDPTVALEKAKQALRDPPSAAAASPYTPGHNPRPTRTLTASDTTATARTSAAASAAAAPLAANHPSLSAPQMDQQTLLAFLLQQEQNRIQEARQHQLLQQQLAMLLFHQGQLQQQTTTTTATAAAAAAAVEQQQQPGQTSNLFLTTEQQQPFRSGFRRFTCIVGHAAATAGRSIGPGRGVIDGCWQ